jgi:hypothetical protein
MFTQIAALLEYHALAMALILGLLIILLDPNAIVRINSKSIIKKAVYAAIIIYYLLIVIEIIQKIHNS